MVRMEVENLDYIKCPYVQCHNNFVYLVVGHNDWHCCNTYKGIMPGKITLMSKYKTVLNSCMLLNPTVVQLATCCAFFQMNGPAISYRAFTSTSTLFLLVLEQLKQKAYVQKLRYCMSFVELNNMKKQGVRGLIQSCPFTFII